MIGDIPMVTKVRPTGGRTLRVRFVGQHGREIDHARGLIDGGRLQGSDPRPSTRPSSVAAKPAVAPVFGYESDNRKRARSRYS